jgi:fructose transport system ATP-binding protein
VRPDIPGSWLRFPDKQGTRREAQEKPSALVIRTIQDIDQVVETLSGGQRQAAAVARAVAFGSEAVVLDEPTAALGVRETAQALDIVATLRQRGLGVILISHSIPPCPRTSDRIHIQRAGRCAVGSRRRRTSCRKPSQS